jgi:hypothetical protein
MPATQTTRLNRKWYLKLVLMLAVFGAFGVFFLYDAAVGYPRRGAAFAAFKERDYLEKAPPGPSAGIQDPVAELGRLQAAPAGSLPEVEQRRLGWLEALSVVHRLGPERTRLPDPRARLDELNSQLRGAAAPKPLSAYDITVQWLSFGGCTVITLLILFFLLKAARRKYGWDPGEQRLYLPGGDSFVPADVADFDKRKWDKFLMFVQMKPTHPSLGGKELRLDLLPYSPLEDWVLEMERTAFPDRAKPPEHAEPAPEAESGPEPQVGASAPPGVGG